MKRNEAEEEEEKKRKKIRKNRRIIMLRRSFFQQLITKKTFLLMIYYTREVSLVIKGVGSQGDGTVQVRTCFYPILASFFSPFYTTFIFLSFFPLSSFLPYLHLFLLLISLYLILPLHPHVFSTTLLFS